MLRNVLSQIRQTLDDAGSGAAKVADEVSATVEALADVVDQQVDAVQQKVESVNQWVEDARPAVGAALERVGDAGARAAGSALMLVALGGLLLASWQHLNQVHRKRATSRSRALPERLHRWEGEGGQNQMVAEAAPLAGQTGSDNTLTPQPSSTRPAPASEY